MDRALRHPIAAASLYRPDINLQHALRSIVLRGGGGIRITGRSATTLADQGGTAPGIWTAAVNGDFPPIEGMALSLSRDA